LKSDSIVTSLYYSISSTQERLIIVGEKIQPLNKKNKLFKYAPRVEIINLDNKIMEERRTLDHTYYSNNSNNYIYDAIIPNNSDLCFSLVKSNNVNELETKVFVWEYIPLSLKTIFIFEGHIQSIIPDPKNSSNLIFFNIFFFGLYQYIHSKKKIIQSKFIEPKEMEISDVAYLKYENANSPNNPTRIIVAYKCKTIHIMDGELNLIKVVPLFNYYTQLVKSDTLNYNNKEDISIEEYDFNQILQKKKTVYNISQENKILFIISRGNLLFVFFIDSCFYFILKKQSNVDDYEIHSIEYLKQDTTKKSSFIINNSATKIFAIFGTNQNNLNSKGTNNIYNHTKAKKRTGKIGITSTHDFLENKNDNEVRMKQSFEKKRINYHRYSVNIDYDLKNDYEFSIEIEKSQINTPLGIYVKFDFELLKYSALDIDTKGFAISISPRLIITHFKSNEIIIFQEKDSNQTFKNNNDNCSSDISGTKLEETSKYNNYSLYNSNKNLEICANDVNGENKPLGLNYEFILSKELENEPVNISISPYGNYFLLAFEESACIYAILDKEIKELFKISSLCRGCSFSNTGRYIAFSTSDFSKDEFNILILDSRTFQIEYIICNLTGHATKILWIDSDRMIIVLLDEKDIFGWRLTSDKKFILQTKDKFEMNQKRKRADAICFLRLIEYGEKIIDFCYDYYVDHLVLIGEENRVKIFSNNCEDSWEFSIDCKYTTVLLVRKLDIIIFGTDLGSIRVCIWPIPNFTKKDVVDSPAFTEKFLHGNQILELYVSNDLKFLYSLSTNGSLYISQLNSFCNDVKITMDSFIYFDPKYNINKRVYSNYSDFIQFTDSIFITKSNMINKLNFDIHGINVEYASEIDKLNGENSKSLEDKKYTINTLIEKERRKVKNLEEEKEILAKQLRETREAQIKIFKEDIKKVKRVYKQEKDSLQNATKSLSNQIKEVKENYTNYLKIIDTKKSTNEGKLKVLLDNVLKNLGNRLLSIKKFIKNKDDLFLRKIGQLEEEKEVILKDEWSLRKRKKERNDYIIMELSSEIKKLNKNNENHKDRIADWEKNLKELRENNADLMESFLFNTLKLKQMNKSLLENESKISDRETIVKDKRLINDRMEKLRFVLEYQIKNLIKEKIPIVDQIKNFEDLHKDFYQRFNVLHAEQLSIEEFINSNLNLIDNFKDELSTKKKSLYILKNILMNIDTEISFIVRDSVVDKNTILKKLENIHSKYLVQYKDEDPMSIYAKEYKIQSKLMINEIKVQKNKVLKDLEEKRKDITEVKNQKDYLMLKIQAENIQLIEECSSIRLNLEDILKYINDIEKKFIELTNTHVFLSKDVVAKAIKANIRKVKDGMNFADIDKTKVAKKSDRLSKLYF